MRFFIRRYLYSVTQRSIWFSFIIIVPLLFLTILALTPDRFLVAQKIMAPDDIPVALGSSPVGYGFISDIKSRPESFFENQFALRAFYQKTNYGAGDFRSDPEYREVAFAAKNYMAIETSDRNHLNIVYFGPDRTLGKALVAFFSERLIHQSIEGLTRSNTGKSVSSIPALIGKEMVEYQRAVWRDTRAKPLAIITILSFLLTLLLIGILEWMDHSLKSERQVARYTNLPVLGSVPNIERVYSTIIDHRISDI